MAEEADWPLAVLDSRLEELDVEFAATNRLTLSASLGLLDSKYKDFDQASCAALNLSGPSPPRGSGGS